MVVPTVRVLTGPAKKVVAKLLATKEARAGPTKVRSVAMLELTVPSIVVGNACRSVTACDTAPLPGVNDKMRKESAVPSTPTTSLWPFVHSQTLPCNPIEPSCDPEVRLTSAPVLESTSWLPAAAVIWAPKARSVPAPSATSREVFAARFAVKISVVFVPPWVVDVPRVLARSSWTISLPPWTRKFVAVLLTLLSSTTPAPVLRIVPPAVPVPKLVLVTGLVYVQADVGSSLLKPMVAPSSTERLALPYPAWLPIRVPAWMFRSPKTLAEPSRARLRVPAPNFSMSAPPVI